MRFTVLGSGTTFPDPERGPAGFLVQVAEQVWLVDGGHGTLQRCIGAGVDPRVLAGGFYSHGHPDHMADLLPLLFTYRVTGRTSDYPVWAGAGFQETLEGLEAVFGKWLTFGAHRAVVHELSIRGPDSARVGPLTVRTRPANHSAGALHLRFEADGASVVFSGDTGPSDALTELARGADLLVCECAGSDLQPVEGHLTPSGVAEIVRVARPGEVWLTHLYPHVDADRALATVSRGGRPVRRAADGDVWTSG